MKTSELKKQQYGINLCKCCVPASINKQKKMRAKKLKAQLKQSLHREKQEAFQLLVERVKAEREFGL